MRDADSQTPSSELPKPAPVTDDPAAVWNTPGLAVVLGDTGGLGAALRLGLAHRMPEATVFGFSRRSEPALDITHEPTVQACAGALADRSAASGLPLRLLVVATGFLHGDAGQPERSWAHLDAGYLSRIMAVNAIGPALVIKHFMPQLARQGPALAVFVSARVGSIGDNALGGWYGYRASKAALNQLVRTASVELARRNRQAACLSLHPGTVDTPLSQPFAKTGLRVRPAAVAAQEILATLSRCDARHNGGFLDAQGMPIEW